MWVEALADPSGGLETETEADVETLSGDAPALGGLVDKLLIENASLLRAITRLDVERIAEACAGWSVDDTALIACFATRSKRFLARVSMLYRESYGASLEQLIKKEITGTITTGWCAEPPTRHASRREPGRANKRRLSRLQSGGGAARPRRTRDALTRAPPRAAVPTAVACAWPAAERRHPPRHCCCKHRSPCCCCWRHR